MALTPKVTQPRRRDGCSRARRWTCCVACSRRQALASTASDNASSSAGTLPSTSTSVGCPFKRNSAPSRTRACSIPARRSPRDKRCPASSSDPRSTNFGSGSVGGSKRQVSQSSTNTVALLPWASSSWRSTVMNTRPSMRAASSPRSSSTSRSMGWRSPVRVASSANRVKISGGVGLAHNEAIAAGMRNRSSSGNNSGRLVSAASSTTAQLLAWLGPSCAWIVAISRPGPRRNERICHRKP